MKLLAVTFLFLSFCTIVKAATPAQTQDFLRNHRHNWLPYALPRETDFPEVQKVIDLGFDDTGLIFVGPYNGGNIDFSELDEAIDMVAKSGQTVTLFICPRFLETEGIHDHMDNGKVITQIWNRNPNYSIVDPFDPIQRVKCMDYVRVCAKRYGKDPRIAAFVLGWGYQGETGFYNGDWNTKYEYMGAECAGYSEHALKQFNLWRARRKLPPVTELPAPTGADWQSRDYVLFQRFRSEFIRDVFHKGLIDAAKSQTQLPVGIYAYIPADTQSYARNWIDAPNADFYRTAGWCASFDPMRTLADSGIGFEDAWMNDGNWDFTFACMECGMARQIALGTVFHAMYIRIYDTEPKWEKGVFNKVAAWLKTQQLEKQVRRTKPTIAYYQPTWGAAVLPWKSEQQKFVPKVEYWHFILKLRGLVESFGLPYKLITEADLIDASRLKGFKYIIVPMWDEMPLVLDDCDYRHLAEDKRVVKIPLKYWAFNRSEFREILKKAGIEPALDFDSDKILAGMVHNLVFNADSQPIKVKIPERKEEIELRPHQYIFINP